MRFILLTLLCVLPLIFALPTAQSTDKIQTSVFRRFTNFLHPQKLSPGPPLGSYETEEGLLLPLPKQGSVGRKAKTSSKYPKCGRKAKRTGYAHYSGWKIVGDDLSGPLPVSPKDNCVNLCNAYGNACQGIFFEDQTEKCYLKGSKSINWKFVETDNEGDSVDLVGGCAAWSEIVPEEMDEICCRG